jgi:hypothetical protein
VIGEKQPSMCGQIGHRAVEISSLPQGFFNSHVTNPPPIGTLFGVFFSLRFGGRIVGSGVIRLNLSEHQSAFNS